MYLSRLLLDYRNPAIEDPYQLHCQIMQAFPTPLPPIERVLFRLETNKDVPPTLLVQSHTLPNWYPLQQKPHYLLPADPFHDLPNPAVKPFHPLLQLGQMLHFRLRANPTIKKTREGTRSDGTPRLNNRVPLVHEEAQQDWLHRKANQHGFRIENVYLSQSDRFQNRQNQLTLYTIQYDGILQITDLDLFQLALQNGIGSGKGFGCGLLSLAPA